MATRATLTVFDERDQFHIYRHYDGYPDATSGVITAIARAREYAWEMPRFEAGDFTAALVHQMKATCGDIYLTADAVDHWDRSFHYHITATPDDLVVEVQKVIGSLHAGRDTPPKMHSVFKGTLAEAIKHYQLIYLYQYDS